MAPSVSSHCRRFPDLRFLDWQEQSSRCEAECLFTCARQDHGTAGAEYWVDRLRCLHFWRRSPAGGWNSAVELSHSVYYAHSGDGSVLARWHAATCPDKLAKLQVLRFLATLFASDARSLTNPE